MFLLIWFKAGIQTSPPIVPLDRETQAQPLGKLLLYQEWSGTRGCSVVLEHISGSSVLICSIRKKNMVWRKLELKLGSLFTFENLVIKPSVLYMLGKCSTPIPELGTCARVLLFCCGL